MGMPQTRLALERSVDRELAFRKRFSSKVESLPCWSAFHQNNAFALENQLRTKADYLFRLSLHLPEMYEEAGRMVEMVRTAPNERRLLNSGFWDLQVGLEHLARHASYCRHALEILSDEFS